MTVSTVVDHNDYTGNGITTSFPYTFRIFKKTDLTVSVIDLSENITVLVLDTDYTVTNAGGYEGGSVVLTTPLANGWQISIARDLEATQETDLRNQGKFFAEVHEDAFDKLTMLIQQVGSMLNLALRKPTSIANWYDAMNNYIRNLKDPRDPQDATTKKYTDDLYNQFSNLLNTIIDTIQNGLYGYNEKRSFELGNTLLYPNDILLWESNGQYYRWDGPLPKVVPPGSTPGSTGGIAEGKWRNVGDAALRADLAANTGAGIVFTTSGKSVQAELNKFGTGYKVPEDFGAIGDGVADDTAPIDAAIAYCSARGIPLRVPAKSYVYNGGIISLPIAIIGDKVPEYDPTTNMMANGSIIIGRLRFSSAQVIIENLGVKRPSGSAGDSLILSANNVPGASARVRNVVASGNAPKDLFHCCLVEGYDSAVISDIVCGYNLFGLAIKSRNVTANGVSTYSCDTGVIIKSDAEFSTASDVTVSNVVNKGQGVCSQGIWIIATTAELRRINISNITSTDSIYNLRISSSNVAADVVIDNANLSSASVGEVQIDGGSAGGLYNVVLSNFSATNAVKLAAIGFCEQITVSNFYGSIKATAPIDTAFEVSSGVGIFVGSNINLAVNYGGALAGLSLGNSYTFNRLSAVRAKVTGVGKPRPGYADVAVSGTAQPLTVGDSLLGFGVVNISSVAASSSYSSINVNDALGQPVSPGFRLTVRNGSPNPVVFNHNPGTGGIANNGAAAKTVSGGDIIEYTFDGANWRQNPSIS
ncbi:glycosyl hydrolase family 28-related protein [Escherichia coli]